MMTAFSQSSNHCIANHVCVSAMGWSLNGNVSCRQQEIASPSNNGLASHDGPDFEQDCDQHLASQPGVHDAEPQVVANGKDHPDEGRQPTVPDTSASTWLRPSLRCWWYETKLFSSLVFYQFKRIRIGKGFSLRLCTLVSGTRRKETLCSSAAKDIQEEVLAFPAQESHECKKCLTEAHEGASAGKVCSQSSDAGLIVPLLSEL